MFIPSRSIAMVMMISLSSTASASHNIGLEEWLNTGRGNIGPFEIGLSVLPESAPIAPFFKHGKQLGCISNVNESLFLENDDNGPDGVNTFVFLRDGMKDKCKQEKNHELDSFRLLFDLIVNAHGSSELHSVFPSLGQDFKENRFYTKIISQRFKQSLKARCSDSNDKLVPVDNDSGQVLDRFFTVCKIEALSQPVSQVVGFVVSLSITP